MGAQINRKIRSIKEYFSILFEVNNKNEIRKICIINFKHCCYSIVKNINKIKDHTILNN